MSRREQNLNVFKTADDLYAAAAEMVISIARNSIAARGRFIISISGGQTLEKLYSLLAKSPLREQIAWIKTFIFWCDERYVRFDDSRNNAYRAKIVLFNKIDIPASNIFDIPVNLLPHEEAIAYEHQLTSFFNGGPIQFDLVLLGLGENGHTASLFPATKVLGEDAGIRSVYVKEERMYRITMTAPLINQSRHIIFLTTGEKKKEILKKVLTSSYQPEKYPAQLIRPLDGELYWFADDDAAGSTAPKQCDIDTITSSSTGAR